MDAHSYEKKALLLTSKQWRLQRAGRQSRRQGVEMKSDWLFDKPRSNYWLRVAASNLRSQSPYLAGVTQSDHSAVDFLRDECSESNCDHDVAWRPNI